MKNKLCLFMAVLAIAAQALAQNPIVPNQGLNDPHVHIFQDTAYVYASHDKSIENDKFIMENWWVWSSPDLVDWTQRSVLEPEDTYIGDPDFTRCWATDVAERDGKYYWYFSEGNQQSGVVVGDSPVGPWSDPLGEPLLKAGLTQTDEYDMALFEENGEHYIIFGVWDYYIAKLNDDMISLAEAPRKIKIDNPRGPYNQDGSNLEKPTDDKPFVHKYNGKYYLSWGCFYATSDSLYGPYDYEDAIINEASFAEGYAEPTWPNGFLQGRHGSFFEWHNQWYFAYCDISQTGNRWFRDTFISYVHYRDDGTIAPIRVDGVGVGNYEAESGKIEAEDYFSASGFEKRQLSDTEFAVATTAPKAILGFPNTKGLAGKNSLSFHMAAGNRKAEFELEIRQGSDTGTLLKSYPEQKLRAGAGITDMNFTLPDLSDREDLFFVFKIKTGNSLTIDSFIFNQ